MQRNHFQSGSSLFEVLVCVLILGIGILGLVAIQTSALRQSRYSFELAQASRQGQSLLDTMRSQRAASDHTAGWVCEANSRAAIGRWLDEVQQALGEHACVRVACQAGAAWCKVAIRWGIEPAPHEIHLGARL